jgi:hypothetical protein
MPYVKRDADGKIVAVYQSAAEGAEEQIASDDEGLKAFLTDGDQEAVTKP